MEVKQMANSPLPPLLTKFLVVFATIGLGSIISLQVYLVKGVGSVEDDLIEMRGDINTRFAKVETILDDIETMKREVATALQVLADHGTELQGVRDTLLSYTNELNHLRRELKEEINTHSDDRFRGTDWRAAKNSLDLKFDNLQLQIDSLVESVNRHLDKVDN